MNESKLLSLIDEEIARLQQVRNLLGAVGNATPSPALKRAPKSANKPRQAKGKGRAKRKMSPEGRARIAAAQKKRWAALKKKESAGK